MKSGLVSAAAALSVLALIAWLSGGPPGSPGHTQTPSAVSGASAAPCNVPLPWRVDRLDPGFGLAMHDARLAVSDATGLWEAAAGRRLFVYDPDGGLPIRFVYDQRQATGRARRRAREAIGNTERRLAARQAELNAMIEDHAAESARHQDRARQLHERVTDHNARVRHWNERGEAPPDTVVALRSAGAAFDAEHNRLDERYRQLDAEARRLQGEQDRFATEVQDHARQREDFEATFPPGSVEAGQYRESVRTTNGRVTAVSREIQVFHFTTRDDLVRVLAHELGHALGLGHASHPQALMNAQYQDADDPARPTAVHSSDLELLRSACPEPPVS